ncbi:MAG: hypothetical protein Q4F21_13845 [Lachnospiraceae bacterium]|nr:hypothetical protein [Lachnospiraceae bacterium]
MKKKHFYLVGVGGVVILLIFLITYFKPLSFADNVSNNNQLKIVLNELGVRKGEPYINSVDWQTITTEQHSAILALFDKYTYKRTFVTLFSGSSISGSGNKTLSIYVYNDTSLLSSLFVSSSGKITVNKKRYNMENAEQFIEQVVEALK